MADLRYFGSAAIFHGGSRANVAGGVSTTYNAENEQTTFNGTIHTYDANGNLLNDGTNTYAWDARHHLTSIVGTASAVFVYDGLGRRMSKTVNGTLTQFLYDGLNPVQEQSVLNMVTANLLTGLRVDEYFTRTDSSNNVSALLSDALDSTIGLVGSGGTIATNYTYQPFGSTTLSGASNGNSYQFTGRESDGTGLYFYRARYYSPTYQRFIAQDPIGFRGGDWNVYAYVRNAATLLRDSLGKDVITFSLNSGISVGATDLGYQSGGGSFAVGITISFPWLKQSPIDIGIVTTTTTVTQYNGLTCGLLYGTLDYSPASDINELDNSTEDIFATDAGLGAYGGWELSSAGAGGAVIDFGAGVGFGYGNETSTTRVIGTLSGLLRSIF